MYILAEDDPHYSIDPMPPLSSPTRVVVGEAELSSISAQQAFALLEHESAPVIASVLAHCRWAWHDDVLALFSTPRREAILATPAEHAPALTVFVLRTLAERHLLA